MLFCIESNNHNSYAEHRLKYTCEDDISPIINKRQNTQKLSIKNNQNVLAILIEFNDIELSIIPQYGKKNYFQTRIKV